MKTCPPWPRRTAYSGTKGCGEPKEKSVSASGWRVVSMVIPQHKIMAMTYNTEQEQDDC